MANRSPNYPSLSLDEALREVEPALKAEGRSKMAKITLAKHLGYTSINGRSLGKMGAIRAYGLISGLGDDLRVTEDAMICLRAPKDSADWGAAMERCATRPGLFKAIRVDFPDNLPSLDNLRYWLSKNGYTDRAADKAADAYLSTMRLVAQSGSDYDGADHVEEEAVNEPQPAGPAAPRDLPGNSIPIDPCVRKAVFTLEEGDVTLTFPADLSSDGYEELGEYLKIFLRRAQRQKAGTPEQ